MQDRNLTVHTYEEKIAVDVEQKIREVYFPALFTPAATIRSKGGLMDFGLRQQVNFFKNGKN